MQERRIENEKHETNKTRKGNTNNTNNHNKHNNIHTSNKIRKPRHKQQLTHNDSSNKLDLDTSRTVHNIQKHLEINFL